MIYFIRVNGETLHNNPHKPSYFVSDEPPPYPKTYFNYADFCLLREIVRIGWPDTGDLSAASKTGALANGYSLATLKPYVQDYLTAFRDIATGSVVMMPNPNRRISGEFYMGEVVKPYHYFHDVPQEPYECSHRVGVKWDKESGSVPKVYRADDFAIPTQHGFWRRAFHTFDEDKDWKIISNINAARR